MIGTRKSNDPYSAKWQTLSWADIALDLVAKNWVKRLKEADHEYISESEMDNARVVVSYIEGQMGLEQGPELIEKLEET